MKSLVLIEVKPISVNECWQGRRYKTEKYKDWREEAYFCTRHSLKKPVGLCNLEIAFYVPSLGMDLDNMIKPVLDSLQDSQVLKNDKLVMRIVAEKIKSNKPRIEVTIQTLDA